MGVSRHEHALVALALGQQLIEKGLHAVGDVHQLMPREQLKVYQHLVVARAPAVYLLAHVAQTARQHQLHLRVNVLNPVFNHEAAVVAQLVYGLKLSQQAAQLIGRKQPYALKHRYVGHGAQHIIFGEIKVEFTVAPDGESLDFLVNLEVFFPKFV